MSYATILTGLHARFATASGMSADQCVVGEPTSIQRYPTLFSTLDNATLIRDGRLRIWKYRTRHRMVFQLEQPLVAEAELNVMVNAIPDTVEADRSLGGRLTTGIAEIVDLDAGWTTIGGTEYRALDVYSEVTER